VKTEILLFASQFATIFLMGFQQHNVHGRHFVSAMLTSLFIGVAQAFVWRKMPDPSATELSAWLLAGPLAIVASMWLHPKLFKKKV
jgi:hypothetical protein